ncbi:MAG: glycosyltransferase family 39 protein [Chitinophagales bacterium]
MKKYHFLLFLYSLLILERFYGIWFLRWAFDEEQNFGGGTAMLKGGLNLFGAGIPNPEMEYLVTIYGVVGKYLAVIPAAMGFALEKILPIDLPIPLGLIFTRIVVSFLPSVLTIVLMHRIVGLISDSKVFLFSTLALFLFTFKHIETSHYGVSDALSTFFVVLSVYCFLQYSLKGKRKYLIWTAVVCVLTVSTKINVGVVVTAVVFVCLIFEGRDGEVESFWEEGEKSRGNLTNSCKLWQWLKRAEHRGTEAQRIFEGTDGEVEGFWEEGEKSRGNLANSCKLWQWLKRAEHRGTEAQRIFEGRDGEVGSFWKKMMVFGGAWGLAFVVINLPYLIQIEVWYSELVRHINEYPYTIKGTWQTPFYFHPPFGVGWGILLLTFAGIIHYLFDKQAFLFKSKMAANSVFFPALFFLILFYMYLTFSRGIIHRWTIPMTPFLVLFAGYCIAALYDWCLCYAQQFDKWIGGGVVLLILVMNFQTIGHVLQYDLALTAKPTTYEKLQNFVDENVSPNTCIYNVEGIVLTHCSEEAPANIEALKSSELQYIIFSDFWFSERRYPVSILYLDVIDERTHGNWRSIRNYIEGEGSGWKLEQIIEPEFFSYWSTNIAQAPIFYVYKSLK